MAEKARVSKTARTVFVFMMMSLFEGIDLVENQSEVRS